MSKYIVIAICIASLAYAYMPVSENLGFFPEHKFIIDPSRFDKLSDFSRAETTHSYDVRHYQLNMNIPMTACAYSVLERIKIVAREANLDTFNLHMVNLVCDSVKRGNSNLTFLANSNRLKITLDRAFSIGETIKVDIFYHRNPGGTNLGVYYYPRGTNPAIMYTTTEPIDSRYWFPCFDENWDKAEQGCEINITTPDSFAVCSNGLLDSVRTSGGWKTYYWSHRYPIPSYLMTFTVSVYATYSHWYRPSPAESIEVKYYIWRVDSTRSVSAFQNMIDMMQFFSNSNMYGPYPFEKYGMSAVSPFAWGGMENQTMTMIHRNWLNGDDDGIAHELSHMWWGDMVTCFTWREIWLNEGFATYSDALYSKHQSGQATFNSIMTSRANSYFSEDASSRLPLYNPPINNLFTWGHTYCKASWIQHMLRYMVGDTTNTNGLFFQTMRVYGDSFKYGNASTQDYRRFLERASGLTLDWFFNEWIYQAGYPKYYYSFRSEAAPTPGQYRVITRISQNNGSQAPAVFHMPLQIKFTGSSRDTTVVLAIHSSPQNDTVITSFVPTAMTVDPNNWVLDRSYLDIEEFIQADEPKPLYSIYPNPFHNQLKIDYNLPIGQKVQISIYNRAGQIIKRTTPQSSQGHFIWNGQDENGRQIGAGVYFVKINTPLQNFTEKVILLQ